MPPLMTNANVPGRMSIVKNRRLYVESSLRFVKPRNPPQILTNYPSSKPKDNIMGISEFCFLLFPSDNLTSASRLTLHALKPSHLSGT